MSPGEIEIAKVKTVSERESACVVQVMENLWNKNVRMTRWNYDRTAKKML